MLEKFRLLHKEWRIEDFARLAGTLFHEHEVHCEDKAGEGGEVIPVKFLAAEDEHREDGEYCQGDDFLDNLELHEVEWAAVGFEADAVGRYLTGVFEECYCPREDNDGDERPIVHELHLLHFKMSVPSECHKDVGYYQEYDCIYSFY